MSVPGDAISIVMPAFNEEANIALAVQRAVETGRRLASFSEVVVVDDGSTDRTAEIVRSAWPEARLIRHPQNLGYGAALRRAIREARYECVLFVDSDNQFDLGQTELLLERLAQADVVVGERSNRGDPIIRRAVAFAWNRLVAWLFQLPFRDVDCGFKLLRMGSLEGIHLTSNGAMVSTELLVRLQEAGRVVDQVPVAHFPRRGGRPTGMSPRVVARAFRELIRMYPDLRAAVHRVRAQPRHAATGFGALTHEPQAAQRPQH